MRPLYEVAGEAGVGEIGILQCLGDSSVVVVTHEGFDEMLDELRPSFIVTLDPDMAVTRQIEVRLCARSMRGKGVRRQGEPGGSMPTSTAWSFCTAA